MGKGKNRQEVTGPMWAKGNGRGKGEQRAAITRGWEHGKWSREDRKVLALDNTMSEEFGEGDRKVYAIQTYCDYAGLTDTGISLLRQRPILRDVWMWRKSWCLLFRQTLVCDGLNKALVGAAAW